MNKTPKTNLMRNPYTIINIPYCIYLNKTNSIHKDNLQFREYLKRKFVVQNQIERDFCGRYFTKGCMIRDE